MLKRKGNFSMYKNNVQCLITFKKTNQPIYQNISKIEHLYINTNYTYKSDKNTKIHNL